MASLKINIPDALSNDDGFDLFAVNAQFIAAVVKETMAEIGNQTLAARALGINRGTLRKYLKLQSANDITLPQSKINTAPIVYTYGGSA